ncbi:hypothetical protein ACE198_22240 [Neobacillus sp. KR4-4]|uniref:hypothetical protein n=1 Tax=Neobacillus sp. KR4-4 TaxID=3344872 RepID=UPI0035CB1CE1
MLKKVKKHALNKIYDFKDDLKGYKLVEASLGHNGEICVLGVSEFPEYIDGMFPPSKTKEKFNYKVIIKTPNEKKELVIKDQPWNYHFVQPIDQGNILLVCARSYFHDENNYDHNARVFDKNGNLIRTFLLGDGIQNLLVTKGNKIWTGYFDEGVFGNYGWDKPVGANGLRAWDADGKELYKYPNRGDHFIDDCYALNVVSDDEILFYFYSDFELGRYSKGKIEYYKPDVEGSDGFIIFDEYILFRGGYNKRDKYILYNLKPINRLKRTGYLSFIDEQNTGIRADSVNCRGSLMLLQQGTSLYLANLKDLIN